MAAGLLLMKSVLTPLAKTVLIILRLSAGMSAVDAAIQKKICGSGHSLDLAKFLERYLSVTQLQVVVTPLLHCHVILMNLHMSYILSIFYSF